MTGLARRFAVVLAALWAGSLVTICGLVAPMLFRLLEQSVAGRTAARFFHLETWLSVGFAAALCTMLIAAPAYRGRSADFGLVLLTAAGPLTSTLLLGRYMEQARVAGDMARFGMLHGVSAILFGIACLAALLLLWRFTRPAT